jgi:hypothetical protein
MEVVLPTKKVIKNGTNRLLNLPHVWLLNTNFPDRVRLKIDENGDLVISPQTAEVG